LKSQDLEKHPNLPARERISPNGEFLSNGQ
jgi:hypothetical protein